MTDEAKTRQLAYIQQIRGLYRLPRTIGLVGCLAGVLLLIWARFRMPGQPWALWAAVGVIAAAWALFAYVYFERARWVRTHPFDPNG
jgi:hypothetical protein